jgi:hypothetical protein
MSEYFYFVYLTQYFVHPPRPKEQIDRHVPAIDAQLVHQATRLSHAGPKLSVR